MKDTKIEWCDHSWSPWRGCTKVSAGCANCYAETLSKRNPAVLGQWGKGKPRVKAKNWNEPRTWDRQAADALLRWKLCVNERFSGDEAAALAQGYHRRVAPTVFPSLCDWLDAEVPVEWLAEFLSLIHATPNLTWLLLTKRPENWRLVSMALTQALTSPDPKQFTPQFTHWLHDWIQGHPPSNVWVGTSVEDQPNADRRIPALLRIPAAGRFLSLEPLLGPVDLWGARYPRANGGQAGAVSSWKPSVDWLIVGGESGPGARPCNAEWVRAIVRDGRAAGGPTFVKQLGALCIEEYPFANWPPATQSVHVTEGCKLRLTHPKGGDPAEWPEDLRVREFPAR